MSTYKEVSLAEGSGIGLKRRRPASETVQGGVLRVRCERKEGR